MQSLLDWGRLTPVRTYQIRLILYDALYLLPKKTHGYSLDPRNLDTDILVWKCVIKLRILRALLLKTGNLDTLLLCFLKGDSFSRAILSGDRRGRFVVIYLSIRYSNFYEWRS